MSICYMQLATPSFEIVAVNSREPDREKVIAERIGEILERDPRHKVFWHVGQYHLLKPTEDGTRIPITAAQLLSNRYRVLSVRSGSSGSHDVLRSLVEPKRAFAIRTADTPHIASISEPPYKNGNVDAVVLFPDAPHYRSVLKSR